MPGVLGTAPNQVPTVGDLGPLAFRDENPVGDVVGTSDIQVLSGKSFSDNVGLGTTAPAARLHVAGLDVGSEAVRLAASTSNARFTLANRSDGAGFNLDIAQDTDGTASKLLSLSTGSTERVRLSPTGRVGIGLTSPAYLLDVAGDLAMSVDAATRVAWNRAGKYLSWIECDGIAGANYMRFAVGNAEALRITQSGNVGIGTSSPSYKLDVSGSKIRAINAGVTGFLASNTTSGFNMEMGADATGGYLYIVQNAPIVLSTNAAERMRIDGAGNVGVGTTSPVSNGRTLTVSNSGSGTAAIYLQNSGTGATATDGFTLQVDSSSNGYVWNYEAGAVLFGTSASERMRLDSSGRLLVGAASVLGSEALRVYRSSNSRVVIDQASSGLVLGSDASGPFIDTTTATRLAVFVGGTERMRIAPTGNLGLGVAPSAWGSTYKAVQLGVSAALVGRAGNESVFLGSNFYQDGVGYKYVLAASNYASMYQQASGQHIWSTAAAGTSGNAISFTQAMTLDASGNLLVGRTAQSSGGKLEVGGNVVCQPSAAAPTLGTNGDMSFQLVSNTSLKILVRGSDGVTRSTTLTLA